MRTNPSRSGRGKRQSATYWRRRFTALIICLAVLAVIAWASSGALGLHLTGATASAGSNSGAHGGHPATVPAGTVGPAGPGAGNSPSASPSPSDSATSHRPGKKPAADGKPSPCPAKEIVLSLFASQHSFPSQPGAGPHALPQFEVDVVSTSTATCRFNVGPKHLALIISIPSGPIWSSADCVKGHGSLVTDLHRGVPVTLPVTWNRHRSAPGCTGTTPRVPAGRYSATAIDGTLESNTERVRLR